MSACLPDMSGLDLCRLLRERPQTERVPILALTGWAAPRDMERATEAGCDAVLSKPCPPEDIVRELQRLVMRRMNADRTRDS
jgi:CheY-like chemotaxis protein